MLKILIEIQLITLITVHLAFKWFSNEIEAYLETYQKSTLRTYLRKAYNIHLQIDSRLITTLNQILKPHHKNVVLQGTYGGEVDSLMIFPIKSATKGLRVSEWEINEYGLKYDRQFTFAKYDEKKGYYVTVTLKECPKLFHLKIVEFDNVKKLFKLSYFDITTIQTEHFDLPCEFDDEFVLKYSSLGLTEKPLMLWVTLFDCYVLDRFLPASFLQTFDMPSNTVLLCSKNGKPCTCGAPKTINRRTYFQDYYPIMMCSIESFQEIKLRHPEAAYLKIETFRPNLILADVRRPFYEEMFEKFHLLRPNSDGRHTLNAFLKCANCTIPNIDMEKGAMDKDGILKKLSKWRRVDEATPYYSVFGMYVVNHQSGYTIRKGDIVDLISKKSKITEVTPFK